MKLLVRRPECGYLEADLWAPKQFLNAEGTKNALTFQFFDRNEIRILTLWRESEHHLIIPRAFWKPEDYSFPVIDCRPMRYTRVNIKSRVQLDHRYEGGKLIPTGKTVQREAMEALLASRGGVLQLSCGGGKTCIALDFAARRGFPTLIVLDTTELMRQWREEIELHLEVPDGVGLIQGDVFDWKKPIVLATYHTLANKAHLLSEEVRRYFGTIIWDECFPAGTLVDGRPIESIREGEVVRSYNHEARSVELRAVRRRFVSRPSALVRVTLKDKRTFVVTPGHPFWTQRGYVCAKDLHQHDAVGRVGHHVDAGRVRLVQSSVQAGKEMAEGPGQNRWERILLPGARRAIEVGEVIDDYGRNQSKIRIGAYDRAQSYAEREQQAEGLTFIEEGRLPPKSTRREWPSNELAAANTSPETGLVSGVRGAHWPWWNSEGSSVTLQTRSGASYTESGDRDRRQFARPIATEGTGRQEGSVLDFIGVDSVEILEQGSDGTYGGLCPDGLVYNIEVAVNHNYFVDDVLVHNCHHVAAHTFSRSANLFYGLRVGLTATPDREDGYHVIYNFHIGPVIYKNLSQELTPKIYFIWTGMELDEHDARVQAAARDSNGELHIGKIAGFLGSWPQRIDFVLNQIREAVANSRKVLVLSKSVDALVNMLAAWNDKNQALISSIPFPTAADVGETVAPSPVDDLTLKRVTKQLFVALANIKKLTDASNSTAAMHELAKKNQLELILEGHRVFKKCESLWNKTRATYLKDLLKQPSTAGLMIYKVKPDARAKMLREKQVTFAIMKYGKEGLNERSLDTIIVNEPLSSHNALQQLMGRVLRKKDGKQEPVVVFLEDDIGPFIGMCKKLRSHLSSWPADQNGPLKYENIGHTSRRQTDQCQTLRTMFKSSP